MIGILDTDQNISKQRFLLNTSLLNSINQSSIALLFDKTIQILGDDFDKDFILLLTGGNYLNHQTLLLNNKVTIQDKKFL